MNRTFTAGGRTGPLVPVATSILAVLLMSSSVPKLASHPAESTKVAEGEYLTATNDPYHKMGALRETWTLSRIEDGRYVVESEMYLGSGASSKPTFRQSVSLSQELRPEEIKLFSSVGASNQETDIQLSADEIRVKNPEGESSLKVPPRYDRYYPLSPWTLSSFARRAPPRTGPGVPIIFVAMDEEGPDKPAALTTLYGRVQCLGTEEIEVAVQKQSAWKYLIHLGPYPGTLVWLSENGLVLASQNEENGQQKTDLVSIRQYEDLPKLLVAP